MKNGGESGKIDSPHLVYANTALTALTLIIPILKKAKSKEKLEKKIAKWIKENYKKAKRVAKYLFEEEENPEELLVNPDRLSKVMEHIREYKEKRVLADLAYTILATAAVLQIDKITDKTLVKAVCRKEAPAAEKSLAVLKGLVGILSTHYDALEDLALSTLDYITLILSTYRIGQTVIDILDILAGNL